MKLEHIGIAVADASLATEVFQQLLGQAPYQEEVVETEGVKTIFFRAGDAKVELLEATRADSPIASHLAKRGQGLHHLAFLVEDLAAALTRLVALGYTPLGPPKPGADHKLIVFLHPKQTQGVLIELCQELS